MKWRIEKSINTQLLEGSQLKTKTKDQYLEVKQAIKGIISLKLTEIKHNSVVTNCKLTNNKETCKISILPVN